MTLPSGFLLIVGMTSFQKEASMFKHKVEPSYTGMGHCCVCSQQDLYKYLVRPYFVLIRMPNTEDMWLVPILWETVIPISSDHTQNNAT